MRGQYLLAAAVLTACDSDIARPPPPPPPLELEARVNVQLGDTPAGQQPTYTVTGEARATLGDIPVAASIDSVIIEYRVAGGAWQHDRKSASVPIVDRLPFAAIVGEEYSVRARLYAHVFRAGRDTIRAQAEDAVTARGR